MTIIVNILTKVLKKLKINYSYVDNEKTFLQLNFPKRKHFIINSTLGLISNSESKITLDKTYQYLLLKNILPIPKTKSYFDPLSKYTDKTKSKSIQKIKEDISKNFTFPIILKKNRGAQGINVFKINNSKELTKYIKIIFKKDENYDYICLAQDYIKPKKEFRVIVYDNNISLAYQKNINNATFKNNLSPLHWENSKTTLPHHSDIKKLKKIILALTKTWPIKYAGVDIIEDINKKLWLIEINGSPSIAHFVKDNGESKIIPMYKKILLDLKKCYS
jgi:glutathione synthase/RimK-type ligase-like ATP-grasp enzyme